MNAKGLFSPVRNRPTLSAYEEDIWASFQFMDVSRLWSNGQPQAFEVQQTVCVCDLQGLSKDEVSAVVGIISSLDIRQRSWLINEITAERKKRANTTTGDRRKKS